MSSHGNPASSISHTLITEYGGYTWQVCGGYIWQVCGSYIQLVCGGYIQQICGSYIQLVCGGYIQQVCGGNIQRSQYLLVGLQLLQLFLYIYGIK